MRKNILKILNDFINISIDFGAIGSLALIICNVEYPEIQNIFLAICIICNIDILNRKMDESIEKLIKGR